MPLPPLEQEVVEHRYEDESEAGREGEAEPLHGIAAMALGRFVSSQLYGIQPRDPMIAVSTIVLLALVSAAAGLIPDNRASRIDPILALRHE